MPTASDELRERLWLALALALRLAFALKLGDGFYQVDENAFDKVARSWAATGTFGADGLRLVQAPLSFGFFALCYKLLGAHPLAARLAQAALGTLLVWVVGRFVTRTLRSERCGRLALAVAAVYPFFVYYGGMLLSEITYVLACVAGLWLLCSSLTEPAYPPWKTALAGASLSAAALCRSEGAPIFGVILAAALALRFGRKTLLCALCFALPLIGWAARNRSVDGHWSLDNHGGTTLLHGTVVFDENEVDTSLAMDALHGMEFWRRGQAMPEHERERLYTREALRFMAAHPGATLRQWARKFASFWRFYPRLDKTYAEFRGGTPAAGARRWVLVAISLVFEPALILGGLCGLWLLRARWRELFPLYLFVLGTMGVHVLSVSQMRYRLPVMPVLMLGLAFLVDRLESRARRA